LTTTATAAPLPYRVVVLCYLFDDAGRTLLLHRRKPPNCHLYSPIGGKVEMALGESPTACAVREIHEEAGLTIDASDLHLTGIVSEAGYEDAGHFLMFLYELTRPVQVTVTEFDEGRLSWHHRDAIDALPQPESDRRVIWPLFWKYRRGFFAAHLDCTGDTMTWQLEQPAGDAGAPALSKPDA
jgi:8-oxo-dGTP diphosphatase